MVLWLSLSACRHNGFHVITWVLLLTSSHLKFLAQWSLKQNKSVDWFMWLQPYPFSNKKPQGPKRVFSVFVWFYLFLMSFVLAHDHLTQWVMWPLTITWYWSSSGVNYLKIIFSETTVLISTKVGRVDLKISETIWTKFA
jgi:hypothetical protein